jgi:hypothetical protein
MVELKSLSQLEVGTRLKIEGKSPKDSYGSVSVKKLIRCENSEGVWHEVLINRSKNYYFHLENYLAGKSQWVSKVYVLEGKDRRVGARYTCSQYGWCELHGDHGP